MKSSVTLLPLRGVLLVLCIFFISFHANGQCRYYVDGSVATSGTGASWASPFKTLNEALNLANATVCASQEIWVKAGTYKPTTNTSRDSSFRVLRNGIKVYGGFAGGELTLTARNVATNITILSGDIGTANDSTDNSFHVMTIVATPASLIDTNTRLDGLTISNGNATGGGSFAVNGLTLNQQDGGGVYLMAGSAGDQCSPKILNCTITRNYANYGAGMYLNGFSGGSASPVIDSCKFSQNNIVYYGGGLVSFGTAKSNNVQITNSIFTGNNANIPGTTGGGAALYLRDTRLTMTGCTISNNKAQCAPGLKSDGGFCLISNTTFNGDTVTAQSGTTTYGGSDVFATGGASAFHAVGDSAFYSNCVFTKGFGYYGGLFLSAVTGASPYINVVGSTFSNNANNGNRGSAICNMWGGIAVAKNCIFSGNTGNGAVAAFDDVSSPASLDSLVQCVFINNTSPSGGGAAWMFGPTTNLALVNCTMNSNDGPAGVRSVYNSGTGYVHADNSIIWGPVQGHAGGNNLTFNNSIVNNAAVTATNYNLNPQFVNPGNAIGADGIWGTADDGLRISLISSALNVGNNALIPASVTTDFIGAARIQETTVDMGAYEGALLACPAGSHIYVDSSLVSSGDGTSWTQAYKTVWEALTNANLCPGITEIWVKKGTYYTMRHPGIVASSRDSSFRILRNGIKLYGGFAGGETLLSSRNVTTNLTTLSGDIGVLNNASDNSYHVITSLCGGTTQFDSSTIVDGFTITKGNANGPGFVYDGMFLFGADGGGLEIGAYAAGAQNGMLLQNCTVTGNSAGVGGGAYCGGYTSGISAPLIRNCTFSFNTASDVGGVHSYSGGAGAASQAQVSSCKFIGNSANQGGAMGSYNVSGGVSNPTVTNTVFENNSAVNAGGAINVYGNAGFVFRNSVFAGNTTSNAGGSGGGAINLNGNNIVTISDATFSNNTTASTTAPNGNAIASPSAAGTLTLNNTIVWGAAAQQIANSSTASYTNSDLKGITPTGTNLNVDPQFINDADPDGADNIWGTADDGLKVMNCSPVVNAGSNVLIPAGITTDIAAATRIQQSVVDIGAYEINQTPTVISVTTVSPTTCGGIDGSIAVNGLTAGLSYTISYSMNGTPQTPVVLTANGSGVATITGLGAASYTNILAKVNSCISNTLAGPFVLSSPSSPAPPTLSSNSPVCGTGLTLNLFAANVTGGSFNWSGPNTFTSTAQNPSITGATPLASGVYSATVTVAGCISAAATTTVSVAPIPAAPTLSSNTPVCSGNALNLNAANVAGGTFTWSGPNTFNSTSQSPSITGATTAATGTYSATVTVNNCISPAATTVATVNLTPNISSTSSVNPTTCGGTNGSITLNGLTASTIFTINYSLNGTPQIALTLTSDAAGVITMAGLAAGSYSNITAGRNGCTSSAASTIVLSSPATPAIASSSFVSPSTCGGTSGSITLNGLTANATYTVTYQKNASPQTTTLAANASGTLVITGLTQGSYTQVGVTQSSCASATVGPFTLTDPVTPAAPTPGSNTPVCQGTTLNLTASGVTGATYTWTGPSSFSNNNQNPSITNMQSVNAGTYSVTQTVAGCISAAATTVVTMSSVPIQPSIITGLSKLCSGSVQAYSVSTVTGATSYTWTLPTGWSGTSTTNTITATATTTSSIATISVTANNGCGASTARTLADTVVNIPAQPGTITGNTPVCGSSSQTYSITAVNEATTYTWTVPAGWGTASSTTNSLTTTAAAASGSGTITVTASNFCGTSAVKSLAVTVINTPATPGAIIGNVSVCAGTAQPYSIAPVPDAATYTWTVPATNGWSSTASTTNNINTTAGTVTGPYTISVKAVNQCGTSALQNLTVNLSNIPAQPGTITGNTNICSGTNQPYNIAAVPEATSYTWTVPTTGGWTINGSNSAGFVNTTAGTTSGNITVTASNFCGTSAAKTLAVTVTNIPVTPGTITGNTNICGGTAQPYSITAVPGATSYNWTIPQNGWTATGATGTSVTTTTTGIASTAGTAGGTITVTASNFCGSSAAASLNVTVTNIPGQPGTISGLDSLCAGSGALYSIGQVNEATGYTWTLPTGTGFTGTAATNGLSFNLGTTGTTAAGIYNLTVKATNFCGTSPAASKTIVVTTPVVPAVSITGNTTSICSGQPVTFTATGTNTGTAPLYQWMKNGLPIGTASGTNTFTSTTLNNNDIITVQLHSTATCATLAWTTSNAIQINVTQTVTPGVSINSNYPANIICVNTPVTFMAAALTGGGPNPQFQWRKNGAVVGTNSINYTDATLNTGDSVSVIMTSSAACVTQPTKESNKIGNTVYTTLTPTVTVLVTPGTNITPGQSVTFTAQTTNVGNNPQYQWFKNGVAIGGATTATYTTTTLTDRDAISVQVAADLVCANPGVVTSALKIMTVQKTGVNGYGLAADISLYPNPTDGRFTVKIKGYPKDKLLKIELLNTIGQLVHTVEIRPDEAEWKQDIDLPASIASGAYMLRFVDDQDRMMAVKKLELIR